MVCPRCISSVSEVFTSNGIEILDVKLGEVRTLKPINSSQKKKLQELLASRGFEILEDNKSKIISQIKAEIVNAIHYSTPSQNVNFSTLLSEKVHYDYSYISRLFSSVEGITIERFILFQKIEKVKELLFYDELTLSEISYQMNYSSVAHLSSQFKKETGMTPTQFKKNHEPGHKSLDSH